jgi:predicted ArsR family transcriptional regulator
MTETPPARDPLALLAEPVRRRLYEHVLAARRAVDRDGAAAALGIGRPLAAFHLDRLAEGGLLDVEYHRRSGRTGPGAGRPAKFYTRSAGPEIELSVPPRRYGLAAGILAEGIDQAGGRDAVEAVLDSARAAGERLADTAPPSGEGTAPRDRLRATLEANGYEPVDAPDGTIRLRNCPFDSLVDEHRDLTCSMNLALLDAVGERLADGALEARPQPGEGFCCVAFVPRPD